MRRHPLLTSVLALLAAVTTARADTPAPPSPVLVLPPTTTDVALFPDELQRLQQAVHAALTAKLAAPLLPLDETLRLTRLHHEGRLREDAPRCAVRPTFTALLGDRAAKTALASVTPTHDCAPSAPRTLDCRFEYSLDVVVRGVRGPARDGRRPVVADLAAPVRAPQRADAWAAAARALRPVRRDPAGGGFVSMGVAPSVRVVLTRMALVGPWPDDQQRQRDAIEAAQDALNACHVPDLDLSYRSYLALTPSGQIARCVTQADAGLTGLSAQQACLCHALEQVAFGKGRAGRRAVLQLTNLPSPGYTGPGLDVSVRDLTPDRPLAAKPWLGPIRSRLEACVAQAPDFAPTPFEAHLDPTGLVTRAVVPPAAHLTDATRACLEAALYRAPFSCPLDGQPAKVTGTLTAD